MSTAPNSSLRGFLDATRRTGRVDSEDFERIVLDDNGPSIPKPETPSEGNLLAAVQVLGRALELNTDEATVLRWFRHERLADFGLKTPFEIVAAGRADAVLAYIDSVEAGSSG
jgi:hypothetical protein